MTVETSIVLSLEGEAYRDSITMFTLKNNERFKILKTIPILSTGII